MQSKHFFETFIDTWFLLCWVPGRATTSKMSKALSSKWDVAKWCWIWYMHVNNTTCLSGNGYADTLHANHTLMLDDAGHCCQASWRLFVELIWTLDPGAHGFSSITSPWTWIDRVATPLLRNARQTQVGGNDVYLHPSLYSQLGAVHAELWLPVCSGIGWDTYI